MTLKKWMAVSVLALMSSGMATAQETYPDRPIKWIVPNPAGGGTDAVVRAMANTMATSLGQPIVVDNRPGGATMIGADAVARSKADGYTLLNGDNATFATNVHFYKKITYDAVKDFSYISMTARFPLVLVARPGFPASSVKDLIAHAKANPGKVNFGTPGTGLPHHLAMELFMEQTGARMTHVPYKGSLPALQDMLGGQIDVMFVDIASGFPFIKDARVKALGIASLKRFETLPDVAPLAEQGIEKFEVYAWQGVVAPAGTPGAVVQRLSREFAKALKDPALQKRMIEIGVEPTWSTPEQFANYARDESQRWGRLIAAKGLRID